MTKATAVTVGDVRAERDCMEAFLKDDAVSLQPQNAQTPVSPEDLVAACAVMLAAGRQGIESALQLASIAGILTPDGTTWDKTLLTMISLVNDTQRQLQAARSKPIQGCFQDIRTAYLTYSMEQLKGTETFLKILLSPEYMPEYAPAKELLEDIQARIKVLLLYADQFQTAMRGFYAALIDPKGQFKQLTNAHSALEFCKTLLPGDKRIVQMERDLTEAERQNERLAKVKMNEAKKALGEGGIATAKEILHTILSCMDYTPASILLGHLSAAAR